MIVLRKVADPVCLQILCDTLASRGIAYRVENAGMNALMPLPGITDARVLVEDCDYDAAKRVLQDLDDLEEQ